MNINTLHKRTYVMPRKHPEALGVGGCFVSHARNQTSAFCDRHPVFTTPKLTLFGTTIQPCPTTILQRERLRATLPSRAQSLATPSSTKVPAWA